MAAAHQFSLKRPNDEVHLVEKNLIWELAIKHNIMEVTPYTFGPRHFLTQDEEVFNYLNSVLPIRRCRA